LTLIGWFEPTQYDLVDGRVSRLPQKHRLPVDIKGYAWSGQPHLACLDGRVDQPATTTVLNMRPVLRGLPTQTHHLHGEPLKRLKQPN